MRNQHRRGVAAIGGTAVVLLVLAVGFVAFESDGGERGGLDGVQEADGEPIEVSRSPAPGGAGKAEEGEAEDRGAGEPPGRADRLVIEVVTADGEYVSGADVAVFVRDQAVRRGETAGDGRVTFAPGEGQAIILVRGRSRPAFVGRLPALHGLKTIRLPRGGPPISGRVMVDGGVPAGPLSLVARNAIPVSADLDGAKDIQWEELNEVDFITDLGGRFLLVGFPDEWSGQIILPDGYGVFGRPHRSRYAWPADGPVLAATRLPRLRGRVVERSRRSAVAGADVVVSFPRDGRPGSGSSKRTTTVSDGTFEIAIGAHRFNEVELNVAYRGATKAINVPAFEGASHDLGDIEMAGTRDLRLLDVEESGEPIADAIAVVPGKSIRSRPSGRDGRVVLENVARTITAVEVGASHFEASVVAIDGTDEEPRRVVLQRANGLEIEVVDPSGDPVPSWSVNLTGDASPFLGGNRLPAESLVVATGLRQARGVRTGRSGSFSTNLLTGPDGRIRLFGFDSRRSFRVRVVGSLGNVVREEGPLRIGAGESRVVTMSVEPQRWREIRGVVYDAAGLPLPGAMVRIMAADSSDGVNAITDEVGRFVYPAIDVDRARVQVTAKGCPKLVVDDEALPRDGSELILRMKKAVDLVVRVVDPRRSSMEAVDAIRFPLSTGTVSSSTFELDLVPGDHALVLMSQRRDGKTRRWIERSSRVVVTVSAGETVKTRLPHSR